MMTRTILLASALVAATLLGATSNARAEVVERVVAVVGTEAIFLSELRRRSAPFLERVMQAPTEAQRMAAIEQLYTQVLDQMVQEELFIQAARRDNVEVSTAHVDRAIRNVQAQAGLDDVQFWQAVEAQGFSRTQYRGDVRRQLLRMQVLNNHARGRVTITEGQVRERYRMQLARARRQAEFTAAHIFVELPSGANATEVVAARRRAEEIREGLETAEDFFAAGGIRLGRLPQGSLPEALEDALMELDVGEISGPVRGPSGFHVFLLEDRQQAAEGIPELTEEVEQRIYRQMMEEAMGRQEELLLAELRRRTVIDIRL